MSTASSIPHAGKAPANANEANKGSGGHHDVEQGDLETEKQRYSPNSQQESGSFNLADEPDEYLRLLKFIDIEAKKEIRGGDRDGGGEEQETRRLWYMPWKKVPLESTKARKVPQSWLNTDMSQGLSESEISERRARFGYNELERYATRR
jgi:H+-transporting ATPase